MPIYKVEPRAQDASAPAKSRLIKADRRAQVESYLIGEFVIDKAATEEAVELGAAGVKVEDATA